MKHHTSPAILLAIVAITGNILFMLWVTFNALEDHFSGTLYQKLSYVGLMTLLGINTLLIVKASRRVERINGGSKKI